VTDQTTPPTATGPRPDAETRVPDGERPAATCDYCGRPFVDEHLHWLHVGEHHGDALGPDERAAHEDALEAERDLLFFYQLKVAVALGLIYSTTALSMMFILG